MTPEEPAPAPQEGLEAFAALAAHQLGEAIALMRGAAAVLELQHGTMGSGGQDALRALNAGGDRAQRYVDDLLDVARAATDPEGPAPLAQLDSAFDGAAAELESFLSRVPVHVQREPLPPAPLEPREAQRLFVHLLRSALAAGATRLGVTGHTVDDATVVEIFDNGTPAEKDTRPFEPFARPRGRGVLVGAGVSLSVCRRIVERRGGRIAMQVRADGATIVTVELPAAASVSMPLRIVLADDAAEMRALLRWALLRRPDAASEEVVVVGEAADGREALAMVAELEPDVVVLDLQMPGPPPGELLAAMAAAAPGVPIVTFSGFEPDLIAPVESRLVALHIPKTTDLALVRAAIVDVARGAGGT